MKYDRLTERVNKGQVKFILKDGENPIEKFQNALDRLAELEDKIEQGTLIELPCKVGDTVYRIRKKPYKAVLERYVVSITLCLNYKGQFEWRLFTTTEDTLGKTVFLTREEAENA